MDKELLKNIRKAYRLLYNVQESIVDFAEYIKEKINCEGQKYAGNQLFSSRISTRRSYIDGYNDKFGEGMWAWDYFPSYMYMYYFELRAHYKDHACFAVIQIMDDGSFNTNNAGEDSPSTKDFKKVEKSDSYLLLAFAKWGEKNNRIWFNYDGQSKTDEKQEIIRIAREIEKNKEAYFNNQDHPTFIVKRIEFEEIEDSKKAQSALSSFAKFVEEKTEYHMLVDEK